jgi:hypothetical protein
MIFAFPAIESLQPRIAPLKCLLVTPLFDTLTDSVTPKSFVCHSYKKHRGWGYISFPLSITASPTIPFGMRTSTKHTHNSFGIRTFKTQDLNPFRIRTFRKTPRGVPPCPFIAALRGLCHNHRSCIAAGIDNFGPREDFPNP